MRRYIIMGDLQRARMVLRHQYLRRAGVRGYAVNLRPMSQNYTPPAGTLCELRNNIRCAEERDETGRNK